MGDSTSLMVSLLLGSIGMGYCIYGRKQHHLMAFLSGLFLMGVPYIIDNNAGLIIVSLVIMAAPKFIKL